MAAKKGGASVAKLNTLHELLTDMFIQDLQMSIEDGIPMSSADKSVIVTFLKNNDITATPDEAGLTELRESFQSITDEKRKEKAMALVNAAAEHADISLPLS